MGLTQAYRLIPSLSKSKLLFSWQSSESFLAIVRSERIGWKRLHSSKVCAWETEVSMQKLTSESSWVEWRELVKGKLISWPWLYWFMIGHQGELFHVENLHQSCLCRQPHGDPAPSWPRWARLFPQCRLLTLKLPSQVTVFFVLKADLRYETSKTSFNKDQSR